MFEFPPEFDFRPEYDLSLDFNNLNTTSHSSVPLTAANLRHEASEPWVDEFDADADYDHPGVEGEEPEDEADYSLADTTIRPPQPAPFLASLSRSTAPSTHSATHSAPLPGPTPLTAAAQHSSAMHPSPAFPGAMHPPSAFPAAIQLPPAVPTAMRHLPAFPAGTHPLPALPAALCPFPPTVGVTQSAVAPGGPFPNISKMLELQR